MKILIAADGSDYTKRMLAYIAAHDEWLGSRHSYTVIHCVAAIPHRAAAFLEREQVRGYYEDDAESVFKPIRAFFEMHGIKASFVLRIGRSPVSFGRELPTLAEATGALIDEALKRTDGNQGAAGRLLSVSRRNSEPLCQPFARASSVIPNTPGTVRRDSARQSLFNSLFPNALCR